jgi:hypothetical protein
VRGQVIGERALPNSVVYHAPPNMKVVNAATMTASQLIVVRLNDTSNLQKS